MLLIMTYLMGVKLVHIKIKLLFVFVPVLFGLFTMEIFGLIPTLIFVLIGGIASILGLLDYSKEITKNHNCQKKQNEDDYSNTMEERE